MAKGYLLRFLLPILMIAGCTNKSQIQISGTAENKEHNKIYLSRIDVDTPVLIDSAVIKGNGMFRFRLKASEPDFYQIGCSDNDFIILLAEPGEKIDLNFSGNQLSGSYSVSGSPGSLKLIMLDSALNVTRTRIDSLRSEYNELALKGELADREEILDAVYVNILKNQRRHNMEFILQNLRSFASIKALYQKIDDETYVLYDPRDLQFMKLVSDTLSKFYPGSKHVRALKANLEKELNASMLNRLSEIVKNAPSAKLDPALNDINGTAIPLSSLKGKYVLLSFWSSESGDCVSENIFLKEIYNKYKPKGFEIYQISLDVSEDNWKRAVRFDELPWISVREKDPLKPENAILYNVRTLPYSYLYDREGNIIATNLTGQALRLRLAQIFGS